MTIPISECTDHEIGVLEAHPAARCGAGVGVADADLGCECGNGKLPSGTSGARGFRPGEAP